MFDSPVPDGWKLVKLSDLGEVNRGRSRHRPRDAAHLYGGPYPFVQTGDVKASNGRITSYTQTYSEEGLAQSRLWPKGTMCITIAANIAETGILQFPACFPDSVIGFIADEKKCNVYFIEYVFRLLKRRIQAQATGSVQDNINLQTLERILFPVPELAEQNKIAGLLCKFDDKIELNRQTNQTLEQIAQAIFKSWFVDFDPVRAKIAAREAFIQQHPEVTAEAIRAAASTEGDTLAHAGAKACELAAICAISGKTEEQLNELDAETRQQLKAVAALFPDVLLDSDMGVLPDGWAYMKAMEIADVAIGKTPPRKEPEWFSENSDDVRWVSIRDLGSSGLYVQNTNEYLTKEAVKKFNVRRIPNNTVLLSFKLTVGRVAITDGEMLSNEAIAHFVLGDDSQLSSEYLYLYLQNFDYQNLGSTSSIATAVNSKMIKDMPVLVPSIDIAQAFCAYVSSYFSAIKCNLDQIQHLVSMRDLLLPELLSGGVEVESGAS